MNTDDMRLYRDSYKRPGLSGYLYRIKVSICLLMSWEDDCMAPLTQPAILVGVDPGEACLRLAGYKSNRVSCIRVGYGWKHWFYRVEWL